MKKKPSLFKSPLVVATAYLLAIVMASGAALLHRAIIFDPYSGHYVGLPISTTLSENANGTVITLKTQPLRVISHPLTKFFAYLTNGSKIVASSLFWPEQPLAGDEQEIIAQIHQLRFNPDRPYVITGAHYSDLFVRNMGVFYHALLDPTLSELGHLPDYDFSNRQRIALQTMALNLAYLEQSPQPVTTISTVGSATVTGLNIYAYPSDSLYGIFYTLNRLLELPETASATAQLVSSHTDVLAQALDHYTATVLDPAASLVRTDVVLSSARDGVKRQSSFYDNVTAWATIREAQKLGILEKTTFFQSDPNLNLANWKQTIIEAFWRPEVGIFTDQITDSQPHFSADSLGAFTTGFLSPQVASEAAYLTSIATYIDQNELDEPFPLRYTRSGAQTPDQKTTFQPLVGLFAPSYMTSGIWSHWGIEYIDLLAELSDDWLDEACRHLTSYSQNIEKYGGYPELYNDDGTIFSSTIVNSVLHSGWVVNYERVKVKLLDQCVSTSSY